MAISNSNSTKPNQSNFKIAKYVIGIILIFASIGAVVQSKFLASLFYLIIGLVLIPPISEKIKENFTLWQNKNIRYISYFVLFILASVFISKNSFNLNNKNEIDAENEIVNKEIYPEYTTQVKKDIAELSTERKEIREKFIKGLAKNSTYITLVKNKTVSVDYLMTLTAISDAIKNSIIKDGKSQFQITDKIAGMVESSNDGKSKMEFVVNVSSLSLKINGGLPKEIIEVFERYRTKYNLYSNEAKTFYNASGKSENLKDGFNIVYTFAIFDPKNENILNAIYETNFSNIGSWNEDDTSLNYPYMSNKTAYLEYLKDVCPDSKYLPKMDDIDVWNEFAPEVKTRIELMIFNKDCDELQKEFNSADENVKRFHNAGSNSIKHTELMDFVDEQMRKMGCYK